MATIYDIRASKYLQNSYFTDETEILQVKYGISYGTANNIGRHDDLYFGLSFYDPTHVEQYPMVVPYKLVHAYDPDNPDKWYSVINWDITPYHHDIRTELSEHSTADIYFYIKAVKDNIEYVAWQKGYITIVNNTAPTIESATVTITDAKSLTATGNDHTVIRGISTASVNFTITANKGSYLVAYQVKNGSKSVYSPSILKEMTVDIAHTVTECDGNTFEIMAEDSRGFRTYTSVTVDFINYFKPTIHIVDAIQINPTGGATVINIAGQFYNGSFGATSNSCSVYVQYRPKRDYATPDLANLAWSDYFSATETFNGNNYTATRSISGLNYKSIFEFRAVISDAINPTESIKSEIVVGQSNPVFDWSDESFRFNVPVNLLNNMSVTGDVVIDGDLTINGTVNGNGGSGGGSGSISNAFSSGWNPKMNCMSSPTTALGKIIYVDDHVAVLSFFIEGITTSTVDKIEITGFPKGWEAVRWQAGGGTLNNYAVMDTNNSSSSSDVNREHHRFNGWSIEGGDTIYARTQNVASGSAATTDGDSAIYKKLWVVVNDSYYAGAVAGYTLRASGTIMYTLAFNE